MKNANMKTLDSSCKTGVAKRAKGLLSLVALMFGCGAGAAIAQSAPLTLAAEQSFTITPAVATPIVLKTMPSAVCDLYSAGDNQKSLRVYANFEGYLKFHASPKEQGDQELQLDCAANGRIVRYPLHMRISDSPTSEMPAPESVIPAPRDSVFLPGLTEQEARQLSDEDLTRRGYPSRPSGEDESEAYASWLKSVTQDSHRLQPHLIQRSDVLHRPGLQAGVSDSYNWSGYVSDTATKRTYISVHGEWNQPGIFGCETNQVTYSAFWVGLDGYNLSELVQAGVESDCINTGGSDYFNLQAWEELLPNQPTENDLGISPSPGDYMYVTVWIGDSTGKREGNGGYGWFYINDMTQGQWTEVGVPLGKTYFNGRDSEWIMERPGIGGGKLGELTDYDYAYMLNAEAFTGGKWVDYSKTKDLLQLWLYNEKRNGPDNNELSSAVDNNASTIYFKWHNYH